MNQVKEKGLAPFVGDAENPKGKNVDTDELLTFKSHLAKDESQSEKKVSLTATLKIYCTTNQLFYRSQLIRE